MMDQFLPCFILGPDKICPKISTSLTQGQWIRTNQNHDHIYHCLNRGDENLFSKRLKNESNGIEDWIDQVNANCQNNEFRRCIGRNPEQCVYAPCKF